MLSLVLLISGGIISFFLYTHSDYLSLAGVTNTKAAVFASCAKQASVVVPADVVDEVWVIFH